MGDRNPCPKRCSAPVSSKFCHLFLKCDTPLRHRLLDLRSDCPLDVLAKPRSGAIWIDARQIGILGGGTVMLHKWSILRRRCSDRMLRASTIVATPSKPALDAPAKLKKVEFFFVKQPSLRRRWCGNPHLKKNCVTPLVKETCSSWVVAVGGDGIKFAISVGRHWLRRFFFLAPSVPAVARHSYRACLLLPLS